MGPRLEAQPQAQGRGEVLEMAIISHTTKVPEVRVRRAAGVGTRPVPEAGAPQFLKVEEQVLMQSGPFKNSPYAHHHLFEQACYHVLYCIITGK